jgi:hypothetical protein
MPTIYVALKNEAEVFRNTAPADGSGSRLVVLDAQDDEPSLKARSAACSRNRSRREAW